MNFIFISPNFPHTYWNFCDRLHVRSVNVLGIGDAPYDTLEENLKRSLTEYYFLKSLENYEEVFRAVAFFSFKYGKIDWIESNNEYWLELDARLRTDFNVKTGFSVRDIVRVKSKALMKEYYHKAGVPSARQIRVSDLKKAEQFVSDVGFPVFAKPEIGVGAVDTFKISNLEEMRAFFQKKPDIPYVMEQYIRARIYSYDAIVNSHSEPLFESMTVWPPSIAEIVENALDLAYYVSSSMPDSLRTAGRATVKSFDVRSRFVHLEFFGLNHRIPGLADAGAFLGLEVNMRPAGGYTPDMMDFAHSVDVYSIWADMITQDRRIFPAGDVEQCCAYAGRRDSVSYVHSDEEVYEKYGDAVVMAEKLPKMMWPQMGNRMFTVKLPDENAVLSFFQYVHERRAPGR